MLAEHLIVCGGTSVPPGATDAERISLSTSGDGNVELRLADVGRRLLSNVPNVVADLIEIASYVFCADQATSRGGPYFRSMGSDWRRTLRFVIPVRDSSVWESQGILSTLKTTLDFVSDDNFEFEFVPATSPPPFPQYLEGVHEGGPNFDEVVLFSGGLDSLAGVVDRLVTTSRRLLLVSHRSSTKILDRQNRLVAALRQRFPKRFAHLPVRINRREGLKVQEFTQRSRSFLYASIACAIASLARVRQVTFFENGVVSINLPFSRQEVGARATRTTHPYTLHLFNRLFSAALPGELEISNPFIWSTKAEVIARIVELGHGDLIAETVSCSHVHEMTSEHPHCGRCSQCIDRRFSILAAGAAKFDPAERYDVDLFDGPRRTTEDRTMAERYSGIALEMSDATPEAFMSRYGGEIGRVLVGFPSDVSEVTLKKTYELHRRHWRGVERVAEAAVANSASRLLRSEIDTDSLLAMLIGIGQKEHKSPRPSWIADAIAEIDGQPSKPTRDRGGRQRPKRQSVQRAIKALFPEGVPSQEELPNKVLCSLVAKHLTLLTSDDTILRAAGRRVDRA